MGQPLAQPVAYAADVLLEQHRAELGERAGGRVVQHPDDRLSLEDCERDVGLVGGDGTLECVGRVGVR